jgi:hypothetical protein
MPADYKSCQLTVMPKIMRMLRAQSGPMFLVNLGSNEQPISFPQHFPTQSALRLTESSDSIDK